MKILSVDPGKSGAIALLECGAISSKLLEVVDTPVLGDKYNYVQIYDLLQDYKLQGVEMVAIEQAQGKMGNLGGSAETFRAIGIGVGMWETLFSVIGLRYEYIKPSVWMKQLKIPTGADKKAHVSLACQLFPEQSRLFYGPKGGAKSDRADAALIGEAWVRKNYKNIAA